MINAISSCNVQCEQLFRQVGVNKVKFRTALVSGLLDKMPWILSAIKKADRPQNVTETRSNPDG